MDSGDKYIRSYLVLLGERYAVFERSRLEYYQVSIFITFCWPVRSGWRQDHAGAQISLYFGSVVQLGI